MSSEAQLYLSARRPAGQDDSDPAIADALAKARKDSALGAWADDQQRVDSAIAIQLGNVRPPPGLRGTILAGGKVSRRTWWRWLNRRSHLMMRRWELIAAAALVMILGASVVVTHLERTKTPAWELAGATEVGRIESAARPLDHEASKMTEIEQWLAENHAPKPGTLPASLKDFAPHGCAITHSGAETMSIVCFDLGDGREVHLVTISRARLRASPPEGSPRFSTIDGYTTAAWSEGGLAMMLVGKVDEADMRRLFTAKTAEARSDRDTFVLRRDRLPRSS